MLAKLELYSGVMFLSEKYTAPILWIFVFDPRGFTVSRSSKYS